MRHREYRVFHRPAGIQSPTGRQRPARRCMDAAPRGSESSSAFYAFPMESLHTPNPKQYRLATPNPSFNPNPNPNQWTFFPRTLASIAAPRTTTRFVVPYIAASSCPTSPLHRALHRPWHRPFTGPYVVLSPFPATLLHRRVDASSFFLSPRRRDEDEDEDEEEDEEDEDEEEEEEVEEEEEEQEKKEQGEQEKQAKRGSEHSVGAVSAFGARLSAQAGDGRTARRRRRARWTAGRDDVERGRARAGVCV